MSFCLRALKSVFALLTFAGIADAGEYLLRFDVVELVYPEGDTYRLEKPTESKLRSIEFEINDVGAFSRARVDQGWDLSTSGEALGIVDGQLRVGSFALSIKPADGNDWSRSISGSRAFVFGQIDCSGSFGIGQEPRQEILFIQSVHEIPKTDGENVRRLAMISDSITATAEKMRKDRKTEHNNKVRAASEVLELAKRLLRQPESEGAGRVLLETIIKQFGQTDASGEATRIWNSLPNVSHTYSLRDSANKHMPIDEPSNAFFY